MLKLKQKLELGFLSKRQPQANEFHCACGLFIFRDNSLLKEKVRGNV